METIDKVLKAAAKPDAACVRNEDGILTNGELHAAIQAGVPTKGFSLDWKAQLVKDGFLTKEQIATLF